MPDPRIQFIFDAKNLVSKEAKEVKKDLAAVEKEAAKTNGGLGGLVSGLSRSGVAFAAVGGAATLTVAALGGAAGAAAAEEKNIARLTSALQANIPGWDGSTAAIERLVAEREKLAFSDDELRGSLALLVGATQDVTKAQDLQAAAMDLARLKNISLEDASTALIRVEGGQFRILKSLGIELRAGATQTEALAAVQRVAAGQAEKYGKTTSAAFESMQIAIGDVVEDIGREMLPILKELALFIRDSVVPFIRDQLVPAIKAIGDAIGVVWPVVEFLGDALRSLVDPMGVMRENAIESAKEVAELGKASREAAEEFRRGEHEMGVAADDLAATVPDAIRTRREEARAELQKTIAGLASSLRSGYDSVFTAATELGKAASEPIDKETRLAALRGLLTGQELAAGLASSDPIVRAEAIALRGEIQDQIVALTLAAKTYGTGVGVNMATGMREATPSIAAAARSWADEVRKYVRVSSPAELGPWSEAGGPEGWGKRFADLLSSGIRSGLPDLSADLPTVAVSGRAPAASIAVGGGEGGGFRTDVRGAPVVLKLMLPDGRVLADMVDEQLYYRRTAAPS